MLAMIVRMTGPQGFAYSRAQFEQAVRRSERFIRTLPGCLGHAVLAKAAGPGRFDLVTVATWESQEAIDRAGERVRAWYREIGFDPAAAMAGWGVKAEMGYFLPAPAGAKPPPHRRRKPAWPACKVPAPPAWARRCATPATEADPFASVSFIWFSAALR